VVVTEVAVAAAPSIRVRQALAAAVTAVVVDRIPLVAVVVTPVAEAITADSRTIFPSAVPGEEQTPERPFFRQLRGSRFPEVDIICVIGSTQASPEEFEQNPFGRRITR
jgi:hypothetical protein